MNRPAADRRSSKTPAPQPPENGKTENRVNGSIRRPEVPERGKVRKSFSEDRAAPPKFTAPGGNEGVGPQKSAMSKEDGKNECFKYWAGQNPKHPEYPWRPADDRALDALLDGNSRMTLEWFRELLRNRAQSDVNPAAPFHKWLRNLMQYAAGPLGRFSKPVRARSI